MPLEDFGLIAIPEEQVFYGEFVRKCALGGLLPYQLIYQTGERAGTTLYDHVVHGCELLENLAGLADLSPVERQVAISAFSVHDLNKLPRYQGLSFSQIATTENIKAELERVRIPEAFPEYADYLADIAYLIHGHSGHHHIAGGAVIARAAGRYRLSPDRRDHMLNLIRATDVADLSRSFAEENHKQAFLRHLNKSLSRPARLTYHRLTEQRGILSNIIHNEVTDYMRDNFGWVPVFFYPEGTYYLAGRAEVSPGTDVYFRVAGAVARRIGGMVNVNFADFIQSRGDGIKINAKCLEQGVPFASLLVEVEKRIKAKKPRPDDHLEVLAKVRKKNQRLTPGAEELLARVGASSFTAEELHVGELLRTYYKFLREHGNYSAGAAWQEVYDMLGVEEGVRGDLEAFDALYNRHLALGRYLVAKGIRYDDLRPLVEQAGERFMNSLGVTPGSDELVETYVQRVLQIEGGSAVSLEGYRAEFSYYAARPHVQCSTCGSEQGVSPWMAGEVPSNLKVQFFSNRLAGGAREPKRNICHVCNTQFILQKINFVARPDDETVYLHFYPLPFYTALFLDSFKKGLERLRGEDVTAVLLKTDRAILAEVRGEARALPFSGTRGNGIPVARYSEVVGNVITLPLNCVGDNDTEKYAFALQNLLLFERSFGLRGIISRSPVPPLGGEEFTHTYLDYLPENLAGLVHRTDLPREDSDALWAMVRALYAVAAEVAAPKERQGVNAALLRQAGRDPLGLFVVCDRELERNRGQEREGAVIRKSQVALGYVEPLITDGREKKIVEAIAKLGELAWKAHIRGGSLERNSLLKPWNMLLGMLEKKSRYLNLDTLFAAAVEEIYAHLERIAEEQYRPGMRKREQVKEYVEIFRRELLDGCYDGKVTNLLADQKTLTAAYLFYVREAMAGGRAGKNQVNLEEDD